MFENTQNGGKTFRTILPALLAVVLTTGSVAAQATNPVLGFATSETETQTGSAGIPLTFVIPGGSFVSAIQFDIDTDDVTLESITPGDALDDFEVDSRTIASGATRVVAYAESGKLVPKTYAALFTLNVSTTGEGTITLSNVIGAADSDFAEDANLQLGTATHVVTLTLVGDATGDFQVDLSDVAQEIDAVFDEEEPGADLHPWGDPDGQVDIRDLLILVRAVLADEWPDGSPLNAATADKNGSGTDGVMENGSSETSRVELSQGTLSLDSAVPIKVLMVTLHGAADLEFVANPAYAGTVMKGTHASSGALRVMFYRMDGEPISFGGGDVGSVSGDVDRVEAEAVSLDGKRISIDAGITSVAADAYDELPQTAVLSQNYPNPFNPTTQFELELPSTQHVEIAVFNVFGKRVATVHSGVLSAGTRTFRLDGAGLSSGQYFYRATGENFQVVRAMMLMK